jgi:hypothetical protein
MSALDYPTEHLEKPMKQQPDQEDVKDARPGDDAGDEKVSDSPPEIGGPKGPEPTRYGDWEQKGRCTDF